MVHVSMNMVHFRKVRILSDFILYGNVLMNSVPWYVKSDTTLLMLHTILCTVVHKI